MTVLNSQLENAYKDRDSDVTGVQVDLVHMLPEKIEDMPADYPESFKDLADYLLACEKKKGPAQNEDEKKDRTSRLRATCLFFFAVT